MSVLSKKEIDGRLNMPPEQRGALVITPLPGTGAFDADAVDLRLGSGFLLPRNLRVPYFRPDRSSPKMLHTRMHVPLGQYLVLQAHQVVLGATLEYIKLPFDVAGEILTKSSVARMFVLIETAPWIHPEYRGCLTLEIANVSNTPVLLYPGRPIGQLILAEVKGAEGSPTDETRALADTYLGPIYPEVPKFRDPEEDLAVLGVPRGEVLTLRQETTKPPLK